jgi:hypothetical protein
MIRLLSESISLRFRSNKIKGRKNKMKTLKNKTAAITIAIFLMLSMSASMMLIPNASAHTPAWSIPTYAYIVAAPSPIGVGQAVHVYMWLDCVFGAAGGTTATIGTNGYTASASLLSNNYRFHNYNLTITAPDGTVTTQIFAVISDTTSSQYTTFTPSQVGNYTFVFTFPGQAYAQYDHYANSVLVNDTYLPSSASTTLNVQQTPIPAATGSAPMPTAYWTRPIYGEATDWWTISSNWLGTGSAVMSATGAGTISGFGGQSAIQRYPGDAIGSQTAHVMWTKPIESGGVVGGNDYSTQGVGYFEGSAYQQRFTNPIIIDGYLYYTEPASFTGPTSGPTDSVDLRTGQLIWSKSNIPPLSFGYIYNLWDPDQHGVYPPILVAAIGGGFTGLPAMWELFDAYTGTALFNVTGVPGFGAQAGQLIAGQSAVALTNAVVMGPNGEQLRYVFMNAGTSASPSWYLAQWNMSKLWQYDINPYTFGGSTSPVIINASANGALIPTLPIPILGETATLPSGGSLFVPYGSALTVDASTSIAQGNAISTANPPTKYDWNVSVPWLNTMPLQPVFNAITGLTTQPMEQGNAQGFLAAGGTNPVTILAAFTGNMMLCRNGSLPSGFEASNTGYPQLPYTYFAVNLNASRGAIGTILWMQTYNPPAGNLTISYGGADPTVGVFVESFGETMQWVGFSLTTGQQIWGPTASQNAFDYYGNPMYPYLVGQVAYGNLYSSGFGGICYCYNLANGNLKWTYGNDEEGNSTKAGMNTFYGEYPTYINAVANGVLYLVTTEHTITDPIYKGAMARAINATTGQEIWTLSDYTGEFGAISYAVADGYNIFFNGLDDNLYSVGRGPSAMSVNAESFGTSIVIRGTVTDTSAGTTQTQQAADFPNGVPVASDASMKDWMGYVYQQKPCPTNFTGVPVTIDVLDSNGNYRNIGTATTDATGMFSLTWTPDIPGNFTVVATFAGTNGYWPSYSETAFAVSSPAATPTPTATPQASMTDTYVLASAVAIIIVIIIIGAVLMLTLRRRP